MDDIVYAANGCSELYALRRADGAPILQVTKPGWVGCSLLVPPAVQQGRIYLAFGHQDADVYDVGSGAPLWRTGTIRAPAVAHDTVVFHRWPRPGGSARLHARDAATGARRWRFRGDGYLGGAPLIVNRTVYARSGAGRLYGLSLRTGRVVWRTQLDRPIGELAAGEGMLIASAYRAVVAYAP